MTLSNLTHPDIKVAIPKDPDDFPAIIDAMYDLSRFITKHYTIVAYDCTCEGTHTECAVIRKDPYCLGQQDTVDRIAEMVLLIAQGFEDLQEDIKQYEREQL